MTLLHGIPVNIALSQNASINVAIRQIVMNLAGSYDKYGKPHVVRLIDNAMLDADGTEPGTELKWIRQRLQGQQPGPAELAQLDHFDLRQPVHMCIGTLPGTAAMSGFTVPTPTPRLLKHFCASVKHRGADSRMWRRDEISAEGIPLVINPIHTPVTLALSRMRNIEKLLTKKHVIWSMFVDDASDAAHLWRGIQKNFAQPLAHHLIVAFGIPPEVRTPDGMVQLPAPTFTVQDVRDWLEAIGTALTFPADLIDRWARRVLLSIGGGTDALPIHAVYEHLAHHSDVIRIHRTPEALSHILDDFDLYEG
ncbi:hypothetical protein Val02_05060 [Virgisporangium aliadipatigenens]|uniref:Uncharacterized protein n=1 Tax=Virgisporangium aliadipatigenens TaxID=741659 RepID=A0A8J3YGK4_9ACTN|nr:hypothetical protein [Virgisporangium aliadipatigenens]GIJ43620.1 hypothetical protein Val02_05060 [Virgisporangium aliadipatigenens]